MLEKLIGVSPPQKGQAQDSKVDLKKDLNGTSAGQYKTDFEKALKEKLALKQKEKKEASDPKKSEDHVKVAKEKDGDKELRAEKKEKKSSGGIKKKMTEKSEEQNISNIMASVENEIEIPESKTDLAEFEANHLKIEVEGKPQLQAQVAQPIAEEKTEQKSIEAAPLAEFEVLVQPEQALEQPTIEVEQPHVQIQTAQPQAEARTKVSTFEKELGAQVGFQAELNPASQSEGLIQKMKAFEIEKNISTDKAQDFEKSVLDQLQKMSTAQPASLIASENSNSGSTQDQNSGDQASEKNLKMDNLNPAELMHAGQSHGEFKTHMVGTPAQAAAELNHMNKLEENHDQNIREIMNQAQYLVKKGGGEMTVKMNPDGLAEVQLKVMLQDGKVNIEMLTQDKSVKKLMEDSLSELKSGLAAHHLSIDHVKISTVNATNTDNSAQFQSHTNQKGSSEQQREYWNRVQDSIVQNNSRRANYASVAAATSAAKMNSVERPEMQSTGSLRTYGGTKGSQVNRVA